jgi:hypothetical protein
MTTKTVVYNSPPEKSIKKCGGMEKIPPSKLHLALRSGVLSFLEIM